ncbi:MAG TPA: glycine betaine ABC transporter substrate-binding protein [Bacillales bacterium]|nr:glycine betaine ABC transporter substrate-binding protein [Bacillales bacterium]
MKRKFKIWMMVVLCSVVAVTSGCGSSGNNGNGSDNNAAADNGGSASSGNKGKTIDIALVDWAETIAVSNVWKQILENKGYTVKLHHTAKGPLYAGLSHGSVDVNLEVWLPHTDKPYVSKYKGELVKHKEWYEKTALGLTVPKYVKIDSIKQLNAHKNDFNGQIVGIEPGASEMKLTEKVLKAYNLDYKLIQSSGPAMTAQLKQAIDAKKPIVVTLWEPHWAFARWNLKFLKDPKNIYGDPDKIYWFSRTGFSKDYPKVTKWFDQWHMSHKQLSSLMNVIHKMDDPEKGAKKWLQSHQDLVKQWTAS